MAFVRDLDSIMQGLAYCTDGTEHLAAMGSRVVQALLLTLAPSLTLMGL